MGEEGEEGKERIEKTRLEVASVTSAHFSSRAPKSAVLSFTSNCLGEKVVMAEGGGRRT